jgi:zinc D-Ala-D-Ala carboxypeptidase
VNAPTPAQHPVGFGGRMTVLRFVAIAAAAAACLYYALGTSSASPPAPTGSVPADRPLSPFDDGNPAIARLDPRLRRAVDDAARDARHAGIDLRITSGWRSAGHQRQLLDEAIVRYGSERAARQHVNTPERSTHVTGKAVDVGPTDAAYWLIQHGAGYGLCQIYANEVWHFERVVAPGGECPALLADASAG